MRHHRSTAPRRLGAAVAVALAVTAGTLTAPALAAGAPAPAPSAQGTADTVAPLTVPADSVILSAGRTGMLTRSGKRNGIVYRWTSHADGSTRVLPLRTYMYGPGSDVIVTQTGAAVFTLTDMGGAAEPVVIDTSAFNTSANPYKLVRVIGSTLVLSVSVDGVRRLHLVSLEGGEVVDREVAVPKGHTIRSHFTAGLGTLAVTHHTLNSSSVSLSLVDPATGALTETYPAASAAVQSVTVTPTHTAWIERPAENSLLLIAPRGTGPVPRTPQVPLGYEGYEGSSRVHALGEWLAYARSDGGTALFPNALNRLTVRSAKTGESFALLDHTTSLVPEADGTLLAIGGTVARGEGLYRIALNPATGKPAATLVRTANRPTALTVVEETLPPTGTFDFDRAGGRLKAGWTLSRSNAKVSLTLRHTASGRTETMASEPREGVTDFPLTWDGVYEEGLPAYNGVYTWTMKAVPANGIGPSIERKGSFTLTRAPQPHDFDDNGSPDVLERSSGHLTAHDLRQVRSDTHRVYEISVGRGWNAYDRILASGNLGGTRNGDLVARDKSGVLWFYAGTGSHKAPFAPRTRIGGGWGTYSQIAAGSDLTGDGRGDLLATDRAGGLWLYRGTGNAKAPFTARKRIGGGWGIYNQLTATGNLAGGPAGDLVARDRSGVLWLYLGKGDGTFAARTRIGGGWGSYPNLIGIGDVDGDGRNDLLAQGPSHDEYENVLHTFRGTGQWKTPFAPARSDRIDHFSWLGDLF
ncbi:FG-GAP repeat domain-containing protein [Streptomyces sp. NPDC058486]|uniref:FG-GAP repeat domain-containing protein n=1 Tax=unclassified Streptomyces TaxID=2593676 RepID=UPI00366990AC